MIVAKEERTICVGKHNKNRSWREQCITKQRERYKKMSYDSLYESRIGQREKDTEEPSKISCLTLFDKDVGIHFCFRLNILQHIVQEEIVQVILQEQLT